MKKFYQTEWQGIRFSDFAKLSSTNLATPGFYQAFYEEFFKRNSGWDRLSAEWRKEKERCAEKIIAYGRAGARILSVGCGLGYMEHYIHLKQPQLDFFIHEVAPSAWHWVGAEFTEEHKLVGMIPDCLPADIQFNLIYLSAVDYALDDEALIGLLAAVRPFLGQGGRCLLISASFQDAPATFADVVTSSLRCMKELAVAALDRLGLYSRGQFWGWMRTQAEYRSLMVRAGYSDIADGFIDPDRRSHYWIAGC